jgi:hypothetical protein
MGIQIFRKLDDRGGVAAVRPPDHFSRMYLTVKAER